MVFTEDDTSIQTDIKVPILKAFHCHIYNRDWHFSCKYFTCISVHMSTMF